MPVMLHSSHVYNKTKHRMTFEGILYRMRTGCPYAIYPKNLVAGIPCLNVSTYGLKMVYLN